VKNSVWLFAFEKKKLVLKQYPSGKVRKTVRKNKTYDKSKKKNAPVKHQKTGSL